MEKTIPYGANITLTSWWKVGQKALDTIPPTFKKYVMLGPTTDTGSFIFDIKKNLPSGAIVKGVVFSCSVGSNPNGGSVKVGGSSSGWNTTVTKNLGVVDGTTSVSLSFIANTNTNDVGGHSASVQFTNGKVVVTYDVKNNSGGNNSGGGDNPGPSANDPVTTIGRNVTKKPNFPAPNSKKFYVHDKSKKKTYRFDGVEKASHSLTLKMSEDISDEKDKDSYINNAKNEMNKIAFDVRMSDVYTDKTDLTKQKKNRSESAMYVLEDLKRTRRKVDVYTNLMIYKDMLLADMSITQDDTSHFGWYGTLTFQEAYVQRVPDSTSTNPSVKPSTKDPARGPSDAATNP